MATTGFRRAGHTPSLVAALLHFDVSFMVWVLLGSLGAFVAADLHLSPGQKGLMVAVPPLGGAFFRLVLGALADRVGIKRLGLLTLALTLVPLAWAASAGTTFAEVLGIGLLLGVAGASFAVALPLASRWYPPEHQGLALGIAGAGNSGTVVAALVAPRLAGHLGWHATFALAAIPVTAAWIVFATLAKEPPRPSVTVTESARRSPASGGVLGSLLALSDARWLCVFYMVTFGTFVGLSGYLPIFFVDHFGLSKVDGATHAAVCAVAGSLLRPVGGALADRLGGPRVLAGVLTVAAGLAAALATLPGVAATTSVLFVLLGVLGMGNGAVFQMVGRRMPERVGAVTGLVGAAGGIGGFLLPFGFGSLVTATGGFAAGFAVLANITALTAFAVAGRERAWSRPPLVGGAVLAEVAA